MDEKNGQGSEIMSAIQVSCPVCGREITVEMSLDEPPKDGWGAILEGFMAAGEIKRYSFHGEKPCGCGEIIDVSLSVAGFGRKYHV